MTGKIVTIANSKGGVGKSTKAVNLAIALAERGIKTLLVDSEKDGSLLDYQDREINNLIIIWFLSVDIGWWISMHELNIFFYSCFTNVSKSLIFYYDYSYHIISKSVYKLYLKSVYR